MIHNKLLKCDLLKDVPYSWSSTKKRTNHVKIEKVEHHVEYSSGENPINALTNNLPIKKRKIQEIYDDVHDENEKGKCLEKLEIIKFEENYICNICSKSFKSYQALGGHKAHHKSSHKLETIELREKSDDKIHKCCFCNKMFSKGQALGGHKKHCMKGKIISSYHPNNNIKLLNFDLNQPPPNEDEGKQDIMSLPWIKDEAEETCSYT
ncbi:hypothetical protein LIER_26200 [Lithospermum erythrorhizon]|uniref:C2H2-type domain-containing protein n=1 Tax=Lithospermum erythrorhizon TaxID=34254 RepID=A0AAV3R7I8_LITER